MSGSFNAMVLYLRKIIIIVIAAMTAEVLFEKKNWTYVIIYLRRDVSM
jgi:positive regulator of sigma E activity